ncbi:MAG: hypothetical protein AAFX87_06000 [Bacteroidota bacterium]
MKTFKATFLILLVWLTSCTRTEQEIQPAIEQSSFQVTEQQSELLSKLFTTISQKPNFQSLSREEQIETLVDFLNSNGHSVDLKEYSQLLYPTSDVSYNTNLSEEIFDYVYQIGIDEHTSEALEGFKKELLASKGQVSDEDREFISADIALWQFLSDNEEFVNLYQKEVTKNNGRVELNPSFQCFLWTLKFGVNFTFCVLGDLISCAKLPLDVQAYAKSCGSGSDPIVDPCENNPNPCCGVSCVQGYVCINGTCQEDPYFDNCANCLPGEECVNGFCRPF